MSSNSRVAKNTMFLYLRMLISMLVSLYTSRLFLQVLGVENYGIYNVVAGFLGVLGFLNASMSGATSRFITFAIGQGNIDVLKKTFNSAVLVHIGIALVIFILGETIGLWFVENKLVIPEYAMNTARIIYQLSIISTVVGIIQTPYSACIIAHERMGIYAYIEILNVLMKLGILYLILSFPYSNVLLQYGLLFFVSSMIVAACYYGYCLRNFKESHFNMSFDKLLIRKMMTFSGWDLYGNMSSMARTQGVTILLNLFFGPIANAASGISATIQGAVMGFSTNIITAVRPQIVKRYAAGEHNHMFSLLRLGMKVTIILLALLSIPLMVEMRFVLKIWLGQVPKYLVSFSSLTLIFNMFASVSILLAAVIHAYGDVRRISLINGTLYILVLPITYIAYKCGFLYASIPFCVNVLTIFIGVISNAWTIKLYIPSFEFKRFIYEYLQLIIFVVVNYVVISIISNLFEEGWPRFLMSCMLSLCLVLGSGFICLFSKESKSQIIQFLKNKIRRSCNS